MNRLLITLLIAVLLVSLMFAGCGNTNPGASPTGTVTSGLPTNVPQVSPNPGLSNLQPTLPAVTPSNILTSPGTGTSFGTGTSSGTGTSPRISISVLPS